MKDGAWIRAQLAGAKYYFGKICPKHPHLDGMRYSPSGNCVECTCERSRK